MKALYQNTYGLHVIDVQGTEFVPGLNITRGVTYKDGKVAEDCRTWTVRHHSGWNIRSGISDGFSSKRKATAYAKRIAPLTDWTQHESVLAHDRELFVALMDIV